MEYRIWIVTSLIALMALVFIALGLYGLLTRKPMVFSSRWLFAFMILGFAPWMTTMFENLGGGLESPLSFISLAPIPMFGFILLYFWLTMQGYSALGITDGSLRDAFHYALDALQLPFEETLGGIHLTSLDARVKVAIQSWVGTGILTIKPRRHQKTLQELVRAMRSYFANNKVATNWTTSVFYVVLGVLLLCMAGGLFYMSIQSPVSR